MNDKIKKDFYNATGELLTTKKMITKMLKNLSFRYIVINRSYEMCKFKIVKFILGLIINSKVKIGQNNTIFKGVLVGSVRSGKREGVPIIGDRVILGANSVICGNVKIGNDVMISPNSFVNFDVPDNSLVIGSPGVIHYKYNPSIDYLK